MEYTAEVSQRGRGRRLIEGDYPNGTEFLAANFPRYWTSFMREYGAGLQAETGEDPRRMPKGRIDRVQDQMGELDFRGWLASHGIWVEITRGRRSEGQRRDLRIDFDRDW